MLNHNIDELLVGIVRQARYQQGGFVISSSTEHLPKNRNKVAKFTNILLDKIMNIGHKEIPCTNLFDVWAFAWKRFLVQTAKVYEFNIAQNLTRMNASSWSGRLWFGLPCEVSLLRNFPSQGPRAKVNGATDQYCA